jgi:hypothetical protein
MGIDAARRGRQPKKSNTAAVFWAVLAVMCLGTVAAVWLAHPTAQPSSLFGSVAATILLVAALVATIAASAARGAGRGVRRGFALVTIGLATCVEILAVAHISAGRGLVDTTFGLMLSAGVVAMVAAALGLLNRHG